MDLIHTILLWIHIPFGSLSLILFWIPVGVKKGSALHKKVGWYYFICMWIVLVSAALLSISNTILGNYTAAIFLGYLTVITSFPLWYSYDILRQKKEWSDRYFLTRKIFLGLICIAGLVLLYIGAVKFKFQNMGIVILFFGVLGMLSIKQLLLTKERAILIETKLKMHIQGTIITGIAAYTAFFAFGARRFFIDTLQLDGQWLILPWILPTILGVGYMRYMKGKYTKAEK